MAQRPINHGSVAGDGQGENLFSAFTKVNDNDAELFGAKTEFYANYAALPVTGEVGKIYVTLDDDAMYRWTGSAYDDLGGIQFVANAAALPATGEALKVYIALDTGAQYRWSGSVYVQMTLGLTTSPSGGMEILGPDGLPYKLNPDAGTSALGRKLLDFSTLTGYSVTGSATMALVDGTVPAIGKTGSSIKLTVPAGTTTTFTFPAFTPVQAPNNLLSVCVDKQSIADIVSFNLYLTVEAAYTNYFLKSMTLANEGLQFTIDTGNNATIQELPIGGGSPTVSTITRGKITLTAPAGEDAVIVFHGIYAGGYSPPLVTLIHDDGGVSSINEILPMMNMYGYKMGFAIIADLIDVTNFLTSAQLDRIYNEGHDLIPHGQFELNTYATPAIAIADIQHNANFLTARGYKRGSQTYCYPGGKYNYSATDKTSIIDYLVGAGYSGAFGAGGLTDFSYGRVNAFRIPRYNIYSGVSVATLLNYLDLAIDTGRGMSMVVHEIVASGATGTQTNRADLQAIINGIATRVQAGKCKFVSPTYNLHARY